MQVSPRRTGLVLQERVKLVNAPGEGQHEADRAVGDLLGAVIRHIRHGDALLPGEDPVHVVKADAAADDQLAVFQAVDGGGGQGEIVVEHYRVGILDLPHEILLGEGVERRDGGNVPEGRQLGREITGDKVGDDDLEWLAHGVGLRRGRFLASV